MEEHRKVTDGLPKTGVKRVTRCDCKTTFVCTGQPDQKCPCGTLIYSSSGTGGFLASCVCCGAPCGTYHTCGSCGMVMSSLCAKTTDGEKVDVCKKCVLAKESGEELLAAAVSLERIKEVVPTEKGRVEAEAPSNVAAKAAEVVPKPIKSKEKVQESKERKVAPAKTFPLGEAVFHRTSAGIVDIAVVEGYDHSKTEHHLLSLKDLKDYVKAGADLDGDGNAWRCYVVLEDTAWTREIPVGLTTATVQDLVLESFSVSTQGPKARGRNIAPVVQRGFGDYVKVKAQDARWVVVGALTKDWAILTSDPTDQRTQKDSDMAAVHVVHRGLLSSELGVTGEFERCPARWLTYVFSLVRGACMFGSFQAALDEGSKLKGDDRWIEVVKSQMEADNLVEHLAAEEKRLAFVQSETDARETRGRAEKEANKAKEQTESIARAVVTDAIKTLRGELNGEFVATVVESVTKAEGKIKYLHQLVTTLKKKVR